MADAALARAAAAPQGERPSRRAPAAPRGADAEHGRPLPTRVRAAMERGFGRDFSAVRVHDSAGDHQIARQLSARAFTHHGHIWLGEGQRADDLALMAHELAHVVQQTEAAEPCAGVIQRQEDPQAKDRAMPNVLPADPAAATSIRFRGIGEYGASEVPMTVGSGPFRAMRAGPYILGPNAIVCANGEYAALYYVAHNVERRRNEWVVGPDAIDTFKAEATSRAEKAAGKTASGGEAGPTPIPLNRAHASVAKVSGIEPHYMARSVPYTSASSTQSCLTAGPYDLIPQSVNLADGGQEVLYYLARERKSGYAQWIVGPDSVARFQKEADAHYAGAALAYMYGPPRPYQAESARFVLGGGNLGDAWGLASHDPQFLLQASLAHVPVHRVIAPIVRPVMRNVRGMTAAAMIGTAEAVPAVTLGAAPKAAIQVVTGSTAPAVARQVVQPAVTTAAQVAPTVASGTSAAVTPAAASGFGTQLLATGTQAATVTAAPAGLRYVDPAIDQAVERSFVEHPPTTAPSPRAPLRRVERSAEATQARSDFQGPLRDSFAQTLQVAAFGQVHHAIEVQVLSRYPGVFAVNEINQMANMRGIPPELGRRTQLHNSKIREILDRHYRALDEEIARRGLTPGTPEYNQLVRAWIRNAVAEIDYVLGQFFSEQRATLFLP